MLISSWKSVVCYQKVLHFHTNVTCILVYWQGFTFFDVQFIRSQDLIIIVLTVCRTILDDVTFKNLLDQLIIPQLIFYFILITFLLYIGRRNSVLEFKVNTTVFASFCRTISFRLHGVNIEETIDMWGSHVLLASDPCCSWLLAQLGSSNNS